MFKRKKHAPINLQFVLPSTGGKNIGGMEMVAADLLRRFDPDRYRSTLVCFNQDNAVIPRVDTSRVTVKVIEKKEALDPMLVPKLAWHFFQSRADIVHTFNGGALIYGFPAAKMARVPVVVHADHGRLPVSERSVLRSARIRMTQMCDHVVVVSDALKQLMMNDEGVSEDQISVIINGVDLTPFDEKVDCDGLRQELGIPLDEWIIGTVGSMTKAKNQTLLVRAAAQVSGLHVLIAGTGPLESDLKQVIAEEGVADRVHLLGMRSDIPRFLKTLNLFVLPSITEATSLALLEAMAAQLPVLATDVGGNRAVIDDTGILIPSDDLNAMVEKLNWCRNNREACQKLGLAGRERVEKHYSIDKTVETYTRLFELYLGQKGR